MILDPESARTGARVPSKAVEARDRHLAVIFPGTKNTQRIGSLILISRLASASRASSQVELAARYREIVTGRIGLSDSQLQEVREYLGKRNLSRKYQAGAGAVEVQDWLLADPELPSHTGAEKEDTRPAIDLAVAIGLLWPASHQRTWFGDHTAGIRPDVVESFRAGRRDANPFRVSWRERLVFAWVSLRRDWSFLRYLVPLLIRRQGPLGTGELEAALRETFSDFLNDVRASQSGRDDAAVVDALSGIGRRLGQRTTGRKAAHGGVTEQTVRRVFEELMFWRLETLVDLGYLSKPDPFGYAYEACSSLVHLGERIKGDDGGVGSSWFFEHWRHALDGAACERLRGVHALEALFQANRRRANQMGYTGVEEGTVVANQLLVEEGRSQVLEFSDAMRALREAEDGRFKVLTSVDRNRRLSAYKIAERV